MTEPRPCLVSSAWSQQRPFGYAKDHLALKGEVVRCIRDEVAAVAAETEEIAAAACRLIEVDYEGGRPRCRPGGGARFWGAPRIHAQFPGNLVNFAYKFTAGDVDGAFREADAVVEGTYHLNYVTTAVARWRRSRSLHCRGSLTTWSTTQIPFLTRGLGRKRSDSRRPHCRVLQPPVGGNFGRGLDLYPIDIITALLARHVGRPVKIVFDGRCTVRREP